MSASDNSNFVKHRAFSRVADGVRFAIRELPGAKRVHLHVTSLLVTVALLAYLGPFGTWTSLTVSERIMFWATTVGVNWIVGCIVFSVTTRTLLPRKWPTWIALVLAALVSALPGTAVVWLAVDAYLDYRPSDVSGAIYLYSKVLVLHLAIGSLVFHLVKRALRSRSSRTEPHRPPDEVADIEAQATSQAAALLARLPVASRARLLHLRMQDHYVEVHTAAGSELLLLRFRDALREVEDVNGLQVHRSHWVARSAVTGVERRSGGRVVLRLVNGSKVPVSRSFAPVLKSRGWI